MPLQDMLREIAARVAASRTPSRWRTASVPDQLPKDLQEVLDANPDADWEYVESYFDETPEDEWDAADLEEYLGAYTKYHEAAFKIADEAALAELGMSAEYGPDQDSMSGHTDLEEEDLETTDTRTSNKDKRCGGDCGCGGNCGGNCGCGSRPAVAARSDVLKEVDATFNNMGVYPPSMKEVGPDTYEGEIDDGWSLEVQEKTGELSVKLNTLPIPSIKDAVEAYKSKNQKYLSGPAWAETDGPPSFSAQAVYSLWGFDGEPGGEVERRFDVSVWDLPDGTHYFKAVQVGGPEVQEEIPEGIFDEHWNARVPGMDSSFPEYILMNAEPPDDPTPRPP